MREFVKRPLFRITLILVSVALLVMISISVNADTFLSIVNPQSVVNEPVLVPPPFLPSDGEPFQDTRGSAITSNDGRKIAQIETWSKTGFEEVAVSLPDIETFDDKDIAYQIIATVRYQKQENIIIVTTTQPSEQALQEEVVLGEEAVTLANGQIAWTSQKIPGDTPNQIVWTSDELIITVASNLPLAEFMEYADLVVLK
jgi:hypothetical protein